MSGLLIINGHQILAGLLDDLGAELANFYHHAENETQNMYLCEEAFIYPGSEVKDTESRKETSTGSRRRLLIECDTIVSLRESGYSWGSIAKFFGASESTIRRRRDEFGMTTDFTSISDDELDCVIKDILASTPNAGESLVIGALRGRGLRVQRNRVREKLCILDVLGRAMRKRYRIYRRVYNVEGPNYLWHVDSNHKLIKWRFILHGAVDGYIRTVLYVNCCDKNRADTALDFFLRECQVLVSLLEFVVIKVLRVGTLQDT